MNRQKKLPVIMDCQLARFWCWAAVAQSINAFAGRATTQAEIATRHTRHTGKPCSGSLKEDFKVQCGSPCLGSCNSPHRLSQVLTDEGYTVHASQVSTLDFQDIVEVIDSGKPLPIRIAITQGLRGGHFICITGYADDGQGNEFVTVLDPLVPGLAHGNATERTIPFRTLVSGRYSVNNEAGTPNYIYQLS